jgi:hypothetical protein
VRRITKAALGGVAGCALVLGGVQAASGEILLKEAFQSLLTDLDEDNLAPLPPSSDGQPMTGAFDSAKAKLQVIHKSGEKTTFALKVEGIDGYAGREFGSHLHIGACVPGDADAASKHYTNPDLNTSLPLEEREIWFRVVPDENGVATDDTTVSYMPKDTEIVLANGDRLPPDGIMSIVIHRDPTKPDGKAGPREVCLPLVTTWVETP